MVRRYVLQRNSCRLGRNVIKQYIDINGYWKVIVLYNVYLSQLDAGFTHTDFNNKLSIVGIGEASSASLFINTIVHESKHVLSHICRYYNVKEDTEEAAYLIGYLIELMYKYFKIYL